MGSNQSQKKMNEKNLPKYSKIDPNKNHDINKNYEINKVELENLELYINQCINSSLGSSNWYYNLRLVYKLIYNF